MPQYIFHDKDYDPAYYRGLTNFIYFGNGWLSRAYARYNQGMALLPPAKTRGRAISN